MNMTELRILVFEWSTPNWHLRTIITPEAINEEE